MDIAPGSVVNVVEGNNYNLSCLAANGKPHANINWYIHGKKFDDTVKRWTEMNENRTVTAFATLSWKPWYIFSRINSFLVFRCKIGFIPKFLLQEK